LRDGIGSLQARIKSLYHLGVRPVARSTFADANNRRPASFFEALFGLMYRRCQPLAPKHKFKFKNKLFSLDATVVRLCLSLFPWASFRRTKGGVKLHTLLDHGGYLPAFVALSPAREHEIKKARSLSLPKGSIIVEDLGYTDYARYAQLTAQKIFFVTRQKRNARYEVLDQREVNKKQGLLSDQTIRLTGTKAQDCPAHLRRVAYRDATTGKRYVFLTNNFRLTAKTIADIYKERWQIGVSSKGRIIQSVQVRPRLKDSRPRSWEGAVARKQDGKALRQPFSKGGGATLQVVTCSERRGSLVTRIPVAETVDNVRRQQEMTVMSRRRFLSPAGYQRRHGTKDYAATGEALGARRRNLDEGFLPITVNGKWQEWHQGGGSGRSVRWTALKSGGLKSLWLPDEGGHIQKRG
jgi:hypothetical protein